MAASAAASNQNTTTEPSSATLSRRGMVGGATAGSRRTSHHASPKPSALPATANDGAFSKQLPHDPRATCADRRPNRQLALPRHAAGQQQAGNVRARNQQHERDGHCHDRQRWTRCGGHVVDERAGVDDDRATFAEEELGEPVLGRGTRDCRAFGLDLRQRDARLQSSERREDCGAGRRRRRFRDHVGHPEAHTRVRKLERSRRDADNRVRRAVDDERGAEDACTRSVALAPQPVADDDHRGRAFAIVVFGQKSAESRPSAESRENRRRNPRAKLLDGFAAENDAESR